ncbi:MAG: hypothetical protein AAF664_18630, partial [Planctomycetota bacterium]
RLIARYRVAGDWQLGAFTPRPRAPRSSLMSVQIHQSAINNTLEQLVPRDHAMAIDEVIRQAASTFGYEAELTDEIPADVTVQFAKTRPITIEIEDGRLWVTMRIVTMKRGRGLKLHRFIVRAPYKPTADGTRAMLVRDGHLSISGPGMSVRQRLPIRAVFNKVLSPNQPISLTLPALYDHPAMDNLAISQMDLRAGWLGVAISDSQAEKLAWDVDAEIRR